MKFIALSLIALFVLAVMANKPQQVAATPNEQPRKVIEQLQTGRWAAIDQISEAVRQYEKERRLHCWQTGQRYCY